jgi:ADP-ribosyl-[dinitrogen reductase] hydrolase
MEDQNTNSINCGCNIARRDIEGDENQAGGVERLTTVTKPYPKDVPIEDRIIGAIMGALIGDALGFGCVYYYDVAALRKDFGWVDNYVDPKTDGSNSWASIEKYFYEQGYRAGDGSQNGQMLEMLLQSVAEKGKYDHDDLCSRMDKFLDTLDGTPYCGRWTSTAMRGLWHTRKGKGYAWDDPRIGSPADPPCGAINSVILAATYRDPLELAKVVYQNTRIIFQDPMVIGYGICYALFLQGIINGQKLEDIPEYMSKLGDDPKLMEYVSQYDNFEKSGTAMNVAWNPQKYPVNPIDMVAVYGLS